MPPATSKHGDEPPQLTVESHSSISALEAEWRALRAATRAQDESPALRYEWLHALEETKCVTPSKGWAPHHLVIRRPGGALLGAAPCYVKGNSEGEFVFDFAWANAAQRAGIDYYPKLLVAVPFTPATGSRILVTDPADAPLAHRAVAAATAQILDASEVSSAHVLFPTADECEGLVRAGFHERLGVQYQWHNRGYADFEDFLKSLPSKRRTQIRRERKEVAQQGLRIETISGKDVTPPLIDAMFEFYRVTVDKFFWGRRYLNRAFFETVFATMGEAIEIVVAFDGKIPIGGAFNLRGQKRIFGRYWGATRDVPFLHFNVCYYASVERAIALGLEGFEPGAGGEHKVVRGFDPTITRSAHAFANPKFGAAVADFLARESAAIRAEVDAGTSS